MPRSFRAERSRDSDGNRSELRSTARVQFAWTLANARVNAARIRLDGLIMTVRRMGIGARTGAVGSMSGERERGGGREFLCPRIGRIGQDSGRISRVFCSKGVSSGLG